MSAPDSDEMLADAVNKSNLPLNRKQKDILKRLDAERAVTKDECLSLLAGLSGVSVVDLCERYKDLKKGTHIDGARVDRQPAGWFATVPCGG